MKTWDIFCRVIDNYGDIGVCWRLARQLANEHDISVRLWVDELAALQHIWPDAIAAPKQYVAGVTVQVWLEAFQFDGVADVVIEAFACNLPPTYIAAMRAAAVAPVWLNLEYLSAEPWVEGCHELISVHPQNGLKKIFYFPGFTEKTGGLLREQQLLSQRVVFAETNAKLQFLSQLGVPDATGQGITISLFSYENAALKSLLDAWSLSLTPVLCLVPVGKVLTSISRLFDFTLGVGDRFNQGALTLQVIPFLTQVDYDKLLWVCDINFVRGEDSFVRAQWAAKPFVWHIYPQDDDAHMLKLEAFLQKHTAEMPPELTNSLGRLWRDWNRGHDCAHSWAQLSAHYSDWRHSSRHWSEHVSKAPDLATNLVKFCQKIL